jgi:hypothetical protein
LVLEEIQKNDPFYVKTQISIENKKYVLYLELKYQQNGEVTRKKNLLKGSLGR